MPTIERGNPQKGFGGGNVKPIGSRVPTMILTLGARNCPVTTVAGVAGALCFLSFLQLQPCLVSVSRWLQSHHSPVMGLTLPLRAGDMEIGPVVRWGLVLTLNINLKH